MHVQQWLRFLRVGYEYSVYCMFPWHILGLWILLTLLYGQVFVLLRSAHLHLVSIRHIHDGHWCHVVLAVSCWIRLPRWN